MLSYQNVPIQTKDNNDMMYSRSPSSVMAASNKFWQRQQQGDHRTAHMPVSESSSPLSDIDSQRIIDQVHQAIQNLPDALKKDYVEALRFAPEVVKNEVIPTRFFLCEQGNTWSAAFRLVQNTSFRRKVLGEDYWLKPLRLQNGALRPDDVALLLGGAFVLRTFPDSQRQVFIVDMSKATNVPFLVRQRLVYYILNRGVNRFTHENGLDVVIVINGIGMKVSPENGRTLELAHSTSSFKLNKVVLVRDPTDSRPTLAHLFEKMVLRMVERFWGGGKIFTIAAKTAEGTMKGLSAHGYPSCTIPVNLGGDWTYSECMREWLWRRLQIENAEDSAPPTAPAAPVEQGLAVSPETYAVAPRAAFADGGGVPPPAKIRKMQQLQSTFSAAPPRPAISDSWPQSNVGVTAKAASERVDASPKFPMVLETDLIRRACADLDVELPSNEVQAMRERNALYSRRSYYKRKRKRSIMEGEVKELQRQQDALRGEQKRLETLLQQARNLVLTLD